VNKMLPDCVTHIRESSTTSNHAGGKIGANPPNTDMIYTHIPTGNTEVTLIYTRIPTGNTGRYVSGLPVGRIYLPGYLGRCFSSVGGFAPIWFPAWFFVLEDSHLCLYERGGGREEGKSTRALVRNEAR
jgi:hypothetical protein